MKKSSLILLTEELSYCIIIYRKRGGNQMKYDLKKPCKDCPFIKDGSMNKSLREGRLDDIKQDILNDHEFICHKTLEMPKHIQQHCAGALIYLEKKEQPHQMMRIAERCGMYDYKKLDMDANIDMS